MIRCVGAKLTRFLRKKYEKHHWNIRSYLINTFGLWPAFKRNFVLPDKKLKLVAVFWGMCVLLRGFLTRYLAPGG